jgi:ankyrin repeat protein
VCLKADTAAILVKKFKADVNAQDEDGTTPLMLAAHTRTSVNVRCLLNDLQANPLLRNRKGRDALWFAKNGTDAPAQARTVVRMIEESCMIWGKDQDV